VTKLFRFLAVALLLASFFAFAQIRTFPPYAGAENHAPLHPPKTPPPYCKPCLFYGGDLDPTNPLADTDANENIIPGGSAIISQIYSPFVVPQGQTWRVTGLFINSVNTYTVLDPVATPWEIRTGIPKSGGSGGTLVASGTGNAVMMPTGRSINGFPEETIIVKFTQPVMLASGLYWENITPQCTNSSDSQCTASGFVGYFESDMETKGGFNGYGPPEPWDASFWNAPDFGYNWENAATACKNVGAPGCDAFSAGVLGTRR
jgi:hypothetical protein